MDLRAVSEISDATLAARLSSPVWTLPIDLLEQLVTPTGLAFMIRARMRQAAFKRDARLTIRGGHYVAEIDFEEPIGVEQENGLAVMLAVPPPAPAPAIPFGRRTAAP